MLTRKCFRFQVLMLRLYIAEGSLSLKYIKNLTLVKKYFEFSKRSFYKYTCAFSPTEVWNHGKKCMNQASSSPPNVLVHNEVTQEVTFCRFMMLHAVLFPCSCSKTLTSRHEATRKCGHKSSTVMTLSLCFPCRRSQWMLSCEFTVDSECAVEACWNCRVGGPNSYLVILLPSTPHNLFSRRNKEFCV